jgi:hypothetical protein
MKLEIGKVVAKSIFRLKFFSKNPEKLDKYQRQLKRRVMANE